jgi:hypothetical protein
VSFAMSVIVGRRCVDFFMGRAAAFSGRRGNESVK